MAPLRSVLGVLGAAASLATSLAACGGAAHVAPVGPPPEYETPDAPVAVGPAASTPAPSSAPAPSPSASASVTAPAAAP